jgi:4-hydroxybenzoate polyprenyltransferase
MIKTAIATGPQSARFLARLLSCIRFDEAILLQGPPLLGACFAIEALTTDNLFQAAVLTLGSLCLVAYVYVVNDLAGIAGDLNDPNRAPRVFTTKGVRRHEIGYLAIGLLITGLALFAYLGVTTLVLAVFVAGLGALYSAPMIHMKGRPVFNSALHLIGGTLHFLLGYATFAPIDGRGIAIGVFFGLVFAAGHFTHEARDCESDLMNGIRTNAVAFGRTRAFVASLILFTMAYALLAALALLGVVPRLLIFGAALYPLHLVAALRVAREDLTFESLQQLQHYYRLIFAAIGALIVLTAVSRW